MLILTRRVGESIVIGDDIIITQLSVHGMQVCYGISAPEGVKIMRDEILERDSELSPQSVNKAVVKETKRRRAHAKLQFKPLNN